MGMKIKMVIFEGWYWGRFSNCIFRLINCKYKNNIKLCFLCFYEKKQKWKREWENSSKSFFFFFFFFIFNELLNYFPFSSLISFVSYLKRHMETFLKIHLETILNIVNPIGLKSSIEFSENHQVPFFCIFFPSQL